MRTKRDSKLTTREITALALISALIVLGKSLIRLPIQVPGHSGVFWMALLVIGRGMVRRRSAGTLMGVVSGILALALAPGREGLLVAVKYAAAGASLDGYVALVGERLRSTVVATLGGAVSNVAKLVTSLLMGMALGIQGGYLAVGLGMAAVTHVFFGALGGLLGALVLGRLDAIGLPQLAAFRPPVSERSEP